RPARVEARRRVASGTRDARADCRRSGHGGGPVMNPVPAQYKAPTVPQVNLIPPEVGERRLRSRRRGIGIGFLAVWAAVLVAVSFLAIQQRNSAQEAAAAEAERTVELQSSLAQYS